VVDPVGLGVLGADDVAVGVEVVDDDRIAAVDVADVEGEAIDRRRRRGAGRDEPHRDVALELRRARKDRRGGIRVVVAREHVQGELDAFG
jgi:hypothetical protein